MAAMPEGASPLLICDLDGTLVDSLPGIAHACRHLAQQFGLDEVTDDFVQANIGRGAAALVAAILGPDRSERLAEAIAGFSAYYDANAAGGTDLYPGVAETLAELAGSTRLAVVTQKSRAGTESILAATGIRDRFEVVITGSEMLRPKPDPGCVYAVLDQLGIPAVNALYLGDTVTDVHTALNSGVRAWAVSYGYGVTGLRSSGGYDRMIDSFTEVKLWNPTNDGGKGKE